MKLAGLPGKFLRYYIMEKKFHSIIITVYDRVAVIFLILKMTNNGLAALSGNLDQLTQVSVKAITLKIDQE